jgi:hypothetical protein
MLKAEPFSDRDCLVVETQDLEVKLPQNLAACVHSRRIRLIQSFAKYPVPEGKNAVEEGKIRKQG